MRLWNKSNTWMIYCKTPSWIFFTVMATHALWLWKVSAFFLWLAVSQVDERHFNTCYLSNFAEGCEEMEPTHTCILDHLKKCMMGWLLPSQWVTAAVQQDCFAPNSSLTAQQHCSVRPVCLAHNTGQRVKTKAAAHAKPWALSGNLHMDFMQVPRCYNYTYL